MSQYPRLPSVSSISHPGRVPRMDTDKLVMQDHSIQRRLSDDAQTDDYHLRNLRELFEQNAGLITPGCRDTIDSILSKYGAVRDEVEQDPRVGLVLSTESTNTPTQQSFLASTVSQADQNLHEISTDLAEDQNLYDSCGSHPDVAQDLMADYADYLLHTVSLRSNSCDSLIDEDLAASKDGPDGYITHDTESTWHDQGHDCLEINHELDTEFIQYRDSLGHHNDKEQTVKSAGETVPVFEQFQNQLFQTHALALSPIMQVAAWKPLPVVVNGRATANRPAASFSKDHNRPPDVVLTSETDWVHNVARPVDTNYTKVVSTSESSVEICNTTARGSSYMSTKAPSHTGSRMPEDSASNMAISTEHEETSCKAIKSVTNRPFPEYDAVDLFEHFTEHPQHGVEKWLKHVGDEEDYATGHEMYETKAAAPSYFAWVEQNIAAEYVLNASMAVAFAVVAFAGQMLR